MVIKSIYKILIMKLSIIFLNQLVLLKLRINLIIIMNFHKYILILKKKFLGTDVKAFMNHESFKLNEKNKPRIFSNTITSDRKKVHLKKVYLLYVTIGKMINALVDDSSI